MLGAAGILAPEVLASAGAIPQSPADVLWFKTGVIPPAGTYAPGYWLDPFSLFWIEVVLMQFAELKRWQDYRHPGSQGKQYFLGLEKVFNGSGECHSVFCVAFFWGGGANNITTTASAVFNPSLSPPSLPPRRPLLPGRPLVQHVQPGQDGGRDEDAQDQGAEERAPRHAGRVWLWRAGHHHR